MSFSGFEDDGSGGGIGYSGPPPTDNPDDQANWPSRTNTDDTPIGYQGEPDMSQAENAPTPDYSTDTPIGYQGEPKKTPDQQDDTYTDPSGTPDTGYKRNFFPDEANAYTSRKVAENATDAANTAYENVTGNFDPAGFRKEGDSLHGEDSDLAARWKEYVDAVNNGERERDPEFEASIKGEGNDLSTRFSDYQTRAGQRYDADGKPTGAYGDAVHDLDYRVGNANTANTDLRNAVDTYQQQEKTRLQNYQDYSAIGYAGAGEQQNTADKTQIANYISDADSLSAPRRDTQQTSGQVPFPDLDNPQAVAQDFQTKYPQATNPDLYGPDGTPDPQHLNRYTQQLSDQQLAWLNEHPDFVTSAIGAPSGFETNVLGPGNPLSPYAHVGEIPTGLLGLATAGIGGGIAEAPLAFGLRSFISNAVLNGLPEHVPGTPIPIPEFLQHGLGMALDNPSGILDSISKVATGILDPKNPAVSSLADDIAAAFTQDNTTFQRQAGLQKEIVPSLIGAVSVRYNGGFDIGLSVHNPVDVYESHFAAAVAAGKTPEQAAVDASASIHSKLGELLWSLNPYNPAYGWLTSPMLEQGISAFFGRPMRAVEDVAATVEQQGLGITGSTFTQAENAVTAKLGVMGQMRTSVADGVTQAVLRPLDASGAFYTDEGFQKLYGLARDIVSSADTLATTVGNDAFRTTLNAGIKATAEQIAAETGMTADGVFSYAASIADGLVSKFEAKPALAMIDKRLAGDFTGTVAEDFAYRAGTSAAQVGEGGLRRAQMQKVIEGDLRSYFYQFAGIKTPEELGAFKQTVNAGIKVTTDILRTLFLINAAPALALQKIFDEFVRASTEHVFGIRPADMAITRAFSRFGAESGNPALQRAGNFLGDRSIVNRQITAGMRVPNQLLRDSKATGLLQGLTDRSLSPGQRVRALNPVTALDRGLTKFIQSTIQSPTQHVLLNAANKEFIDRIGGYRNLKEETARKVLATPGITSADATAYANGVRSARTMADFQAVMRDFATKYPLVDDAANVGTLGYAGPPARQVGTPGVLDTGDVDVLRGMRRGNPPTNGAANGHSVSDFRNWQTVEENLGRAERAGDERTAAALRERLGQFDRPKVGRDVDPGQPYGVEHLLPDHGVGAGLRPFEGQPLGPAERDAAPIGHAGEPPNGGAESTWYHGTGATDLHPGNLYPSMTNATGLYGPGIYMTDNPEVAGSYGRGALRKGKAGAEESTVYEAKVGAGKVLDLDTPAPQDVRDLWRDAMVDASVGGDPEWEALLNNPQASTRDFFDQVRLMARSGDLDADIGDVFEGINIWARELGYDAYTHVGGNRVGNVEHRVYIALDPTDTYGRGASDTIRSFDRTSYGPEGTRVLGENPASNPDLHAQAAQWGRQQFEDTVAGASVPIGHAGPPPAAGGIAAADRAGILSDIQRTGTQYTQGLNDIRQGGLERGYRIVGNTADQTNLGHAFKEGVQIPQGVPGIGGLTVLPAILPFAPFHIHSTQFWLRQFAESPYMPVAIMSALKQAGIDDYGNYGLPGGGSVNGVTRLTTAGHIMDWALKAQTYFEDLRRNPNGNSIFQQLLKNAAYDTVGNNPFVAPFGTYAGLGQSLTQGATEPLMTTDKQGRVVPDRRDIPYERGAEGWIEGGLNLAGVNRGVSHVIGGAGNLASNLGQKVGMGIGERLGGDTRIKEYNADSQKPYFAREFATSNGWDDKRMQAAVNNPNSPDGQAFEVAYQKRLDVTGLGKALPLRFQAADTPGKPFFPETPHFADRYRAGEGGRDAGVGITTKGGNYFLEPKEQAEERTARAQISAKSPISRETVPMMDYARDFLQQTGNTFTYPGNRTETGALASRADAIYKNELEGNARKTGAGLPQDQRLTKIDQEQRLQTPISPDGMTAAQLLNQDGNYYKTLDKIDAAKKQYGDNSPEVRALERALSEVRAKDVAQASGVLGPYFDQQHKDDLVKYGDQTFRGKLSPKEQDAYDAFNDLKNSADYKKRNDLETELGKIIGGKDAPKGSAEHTAYTEWFKAHGDDLTRLSNIVYGAEQDIVNRFGVNPRELANRAAIAGGYDPTYKDTTIPGQKAPFAPTGGGGAGGVGTQTGGKGGGRNYPTSGGRGGGGSTYADTRAAGDSFFNEWRTLTSKEKASLGRDPAVQHALSGGNTRTAKDYTKALSVIEARNVAGTSNTTSSSKYQRAPDQFVGTGRGLTPDQLARGVDSIIGGQEHSIIGFQDRARTSPDAPGSSNGQGRSSNASNVSQSLTSDSTPIGYSGAPAKPKYTTPYVSRAEYIANLKKKGK